MFRRNKEENKARLEHKLYLARETPEPIFDLSDCGLRNVPQGIYSLCKVFRKEILRLEENGLNSLKGGGNLKDLELLKILDIHDNAFITLPDDVGFLKNLQELYVNNNRLKFLPETICNLLKLRILDVSNNSLKALPEEIGNLSKLKFLNVSGNNRLQYLPKSLNRAISLKSMVLDCENLVYPPGDVAKNGTEAIRRYICDDVGVEYVYCDNLDEDDVEEQHKATLQEDDRLKARLWELESIKNQKLKEFLEIEKHNELMQRQEIELANAHKLNKQQLLASISYQQNKFDMKLNKVQQEKEVERFRLIEQLHQEEQKADVAINKLLELSKMPMQQLLEQEKLEEKRLLAATMKYNETLRKDDILRDMEEVLQQETLRFQELHQNRIETTKGILQHEMEVDSQVLEILQDKDTHKVELHAKLQEDSELQKLAVATLLERGDARSWGLVQQVILVETQLAALTHIEMDRRKLEIDQQMNSLAEKRVNLSMLLMELLEQQQARREQLLVILRLMENSLTVNKENFWLKQYQQLLDRLPPGISEAQKNIEPALAQALLGNGVLHCLPLLAKLLQFQSDIEDITDSDLREAGVTSKIDRDHILNAFHTYAKEYSSTLISPSAPEPSLEEASAPPQEHSSQSIIEEECVVCMDQRVQVIFLPCGHLCCCSACSRTLLDCPLCRNTIERKIKIVVA